MGLITLVTATSFKSFEKKRKFVGSWFEYVGPQSSGNYASLSDARTRSNWIYITNPPTTTGADYLKAIYVDITETDDNGTVDFTDDSPLVDISSTDIYSALGLAKSATTGKWSMLSHSSARVEVNNQP
jgi:hypothetical protein